MLRGPCHIDLLYSVISTRILDLEASEFRSFEFVVIRASPDMVSALMHSPLGKFRHGGVEILSAENNLQYLQSVDQR